MINEPKFFMMCLNFTNPLLNDPQKRFSQVFSIYTCVWRRRKIYKTFSCENFHPWMDFPCIRTLSLFSTSKQGRVKPCEHTKHMCDDRYPFYELYSSIYSTSSSNIKRLMEEEGGGEEKSSLNFKWFYWN